MRFVTLDTETTGLNFKGSVSKNHRIIEIACVEIIDGKITGREFHSLINPGIKIDAKATEIHGISTISLSGKPEFKDIVKEFLKFIDGAPIIIHNAPFDIEFLNKEFSLLKGCLQPKGTFQYIDTLPIARSIFQGEDNTLDALSNKFGLTESKERKHGALEDAKLLANIFLIIS